MVILTIFNISWKTVFKRESTLPITSMFQDFVHYVLARRVFLEQQSLLSIIPFHLPLKYLFRTCGVHAFINIKLVYVYVNVLLWVCHCTFVVPLLVTSLTFDTRLVILDAVSLILIELILVNIYTSMAPFYIARSKVL